jgi:ethanolamine ammonia-lyase small subunit
MSERLPQGENLDAALDTLPALSPSLAGRLRALTPARVGLRRAGSSIATGEVLDFQLAHGRARDAVHAALQPASLLPALHTASGLEVLLLRSAAADRKTYLQRPDLGRKLDAASALKLREMQSSNALDLLFVVADGLSALAIERHAAPLLAELIQMAAKALPGLRIGPVCVVEQARVAIGDEVAALLGSQLAVVLIGERPGLSSPDSLGAYITWAPLPCMTTDAERNCISNIRAEGLSYAQAATRLLHYITEARSKQLTGVNLKDPDEVRCSMTMGSEVVESVKQIGDAAHG